jgi:hypothetical protein
MSEPGVGVVGVDGGELAGVESVGVALVAEVVVVEGPEGSALGAEGGVTLCLRADSGGLQKIVRVVRIVSPTAKALV